MGVMLARLVCDSNASRMQLTGVEDQRKDLRKELAALKAQAKK